MRRSTLDEPITKQHSKGHDKDTRRAAEYFGQNSRWIREKPAFSDEIARLFR
jgi:hypothetical protein